MLDEDTEEEKKKKEQEQRVQKEIQNASGDGQGTVVSINDNDERIYYFGARYYDSDLGRWTSVDPLASKYPGWSPYNYTLCNPLNVTDPDGRFGVAVAAVVWAIIEAITAETVVTVGVSIATTAIIYDKVANNGEGFGVRKVNIGSPTTTVPSDATSVGGNSETLLDQGANQTNILESSGGQSVEHVADVLGIPVSEAHAKIKEIKGSYDGNPDINIDKDGNIRIKPTTGKNKGKEFETGEHVNDYK